MRNTVVYRLAIDSMMAALYAVLAVLSIRIGNNITITPASIAIVITAILYSPSDAITVALVGELINQTAKYGIGPTTVLWLLPVLLRASVISIVAYLYRRHDTYLENHYIAYFITLFVAALLTTAANTLVIYIDAKLLNYPDGLTIIETIFRFISSMITSILVAIVSLPVLKALSKLSIGRSLSRSDALKLKQQKELAMASLEEESLNSKIKN